MIRAGGRSGGGQLAVVAVLALAATGCELDELRLDRRPTRRWIEVSSPHFRILTDTTESHGRSLVEEFERERELLARIAFPTWEAPEEPLDVILFEDVYEFREFAPKDASAYYQQTERELLGPAPRIVASAGEGYLTAVGQSRTTLLHELVHRFVALNRPFVPTWLNEGLAQYYGTLEEDRSAHEVMVGKPAATALVADWSPIGDLIGASSVSFYRDYRSAQNYGAAWGLTHFLMHHPGERSRLDCLLWQRNGREPVIDAERRCLRTDDPRTLDVAVRSYFEGALSPGLRVPAPPFSAAPTVKLREMSGVEVLRLRASLLDVTRKEGWEKASPILARVLTLAPDDPETHLALADAAGARAAWGEMVGALRRADQLRPNDPHILAGLAVALYLGRSRGPTDGAGERLGEIAALFDRVVALPCSAAEMSFAARFASGRPGHADEALSLARRSVERNPSCADCHLALAEVLQAHGEIQAALEELRRDIALQADGHASVHLLKMEHEWEVLAATGKP